MEEKHTVLRMFFPPVKLIKVGKHLSGPITY